MEPTYCKKRSYDVFVNQRGSDNQLKCSKFPHQDELITEMVRQIKDKRVDGKNILMRAAGTNSSLANRIIPILLDAGVSLEPNSDGQTALHAAVLANNLFVVQQLIAHGTNVNYQDKDHNAPIMFARTPEMIDLLIKNRAFTWLVNRAGLTIHEIAAQLFPNNHELTQLLVESDPNKKWAKQN